MGFRVAPLPLASGIFWMTFYADPATLRPYLIEFHGKSSVRVATATIDAFPEFEYNPGVMA